jgi:hypothetical protein
MRNDADSGAHGNDEPVAHLHSLKATDPGPVKNFKRRPAVPTPVGPSDFPKHRLSQCLRIPRAIIERNGGRECTEREGAAFAGLRFARGTRAEICSAVKYGLLDRRGIGRVRPTAIARKIFMSKNASQRMAAMRRALLHAPVLSDLYRRLQGRRLSDLRSLMESMKTSIEVSSENMHSLVVVLIRSLADAKLLEDVDGAQRVIGCRYRPRRRGGIKT